MRKNWFLVVISLMIVLCGCSVINQDIKPPTIKNIQVKPRNLPYFIGGEVTITAEVNDESGIERVWAKVRKPDGIEEIVPMKLKEGIYQGTIRAGVNTRSDGQDEVYIVWVFARDIKGNEAGEPREGVKFTVPAPLRPPGKPNFVPAPMPPPNSPF